MSVPVISPFVVVITDEFLCVSKLPAQTKAQAVKIVNTWLTNMDSTPIYEITIEINI
jgi:hypothetical protein